VIKRLDLENLQFSVVCALVISILMIATIIFIIFYHDSKHEELDSWVNFSFNVSSLRQTFSYYRFMAVSMLLFYVLFTVNCIFLQLDNYMIFADTEKNPVYANPISVAFFSLDLVLRGGFFDLMEHFDLKITSLFINKNVTWFWIYSFVFRLFYGLTLIKIVTSFVWIYSKIRLAKQAQSKTEQRNFLFD